MNYNTKSGVFGRSRASSTSAPVSGTLGKTKYSNFDWDKIDWNEGLSSLTKMFGDIFGTSDKAVVNAQNQIINQQEKTMTILWVVIGLMAALGVVLLIRKTK